MIDRLCLLSKYSHNICVFVFEMHNVLTCVIENIKNLIENVNILLKLTDF